MPRGGKRRGAGRKPDWRHGKTRTIRVPEALVEEILEYAHKLDTGDTTDYDTISKVVDLSGITIPEIRGKRFVFLSDLIKVGYLIEPEKLANKAIDEIYREQVVSYSR
ncbi:MAG: hypothetical protein F6J96_35065 [Symploca sp. SIO1C2]|nr:hypothetical protein [Symploca sp. SIO2G7]NER25828.1 hypothetical protein [Symploca sp. SIO1C2]